MKKTIIFLNIFLLIKLMAIGQDLSIHVDLKWEGVQVVSGEKESPVKSITFQGAVHTSLNEYAPIYHTTLKVRDGIQECSVQLANERYETLTAIETENLPYAGRLTEAVQVEQEVGVARHVSLLDIHMVPVEKMASGGYRKLISFDMLITYGKSLKSGEEEHSFAEHSVLSNGKWYKVKVNATGVCKVTYDDLAGMGVDMSTVIPSKIRVFGKPGGMLPESNKSFRYDDLPENAIQVVTATEGVFAPGDYFLFYGTSADEVYYNNATKKFEHRQNLYSDYNYYFLNFDGAEGKRISIENQSTATPKNKYNSFVDFKWYEKDLYNFIKSGKQWIGDRLDFGSPSFTIPGLHFDNVQPNRQAWIRYRLVARSNISSNFSITTNDFTLVSKSLAAYTAETFTQEAVETKSFIPVEGDQTITVQYNTPTSSSLGYIDWVEVNVPRKLQFSSGQLIFAEPISAFAGNISEFNLSGTNPHTTIWDVSYPTEVKKVDASRVGDTLKFVLSTDSLKRFVAWDNTTFNAVEFDKIVENQDLHGIEYADMLIVTHPDFLTQAERLAQHHRIVDGMTVVVATNEQIYNEFSSGAPDVAAIRDLARMLYLRPGDGKQLQYLLLFGDGSYDYKDHIPQNTNYVLAFETQESQNLVFSTASDDFFGLMDLSEGADAAGKLDIGIGRFPVDNAEQAERMVDKCIFYATGAPENLGDWRNTLCFIADDEDSNTHIRQVEDQVTPVIEKNHTIYNINKIYLDAYTQVSTPSGTRYPEVNNLINESVQKGVLIMNYTGHGGETGWATESILTLSDINSWTNFDNMPVFVTATCEFSRFDDPGRVSAGEQVFLNPAGGGVALLTTTRLANAGNNVELTIDLYDTLFSKKGNHTPRFGDVIAFAKNENSNVGLIRNFMLIGDPAMHLATPRYNVETTLINGVPVDVNADTIRAMSEVHVEGEITDDDNNRVDSFTGTVDVKVYDKYKWMMTRGNDPTSFKRYFDVQDNILYQGKASVTAGQFSFTFIVPKDIDFSYGIGKISYYAYNATSDASGYSDSIVIGGISNEVATDMVGPQITMYLNDERFINGGITGENPLLIAYLSDESGLNTVGNGIGHDLVATIDDNSTNSFVLNDYYQADLDNYQSGKLTYYLQGLTEGPHFLTLKAWDVFNNSSEARIDFTVNKNLPVKVMDVKVYPNPFHESITVEFEHNLFDSELDVTLEVFSMNGSLIRRLDPVTIYSQGYYSGVINWDGRGSTGAPVGDGLYLLKVSATNGKSTSSKTVRVIRITNQ